MLKKLANFLEKIQVTMGIMFLSIFFLVIVIQMFARYSGISLIWTEEVANNAFIWSVFMGASVMVHRKGHFRFSLLYEKLNGKARSFMVLIINLILLVFCGTVFYYGIIASQNFWNYNWFSLPQIKMGYMFVSIPIMGGTMFIYILDHIVDSIYELRGAKE